MKDWIIRFYYGIVATEWASEIILLSLSGTVLYHVWKKGENRLEQSGYESACFVSLLLTLAGFLIPFHFWFMHWFGNLISRHKPNIFDWESPYMSWTAKVLLLIWIGGMIVQAIRQFGKGSGIRKKLSKRMECGKAAREVFENVCRELKVKPGRVKLYQSYNTDIPCMTGLFRPSVILPVKEYTKEELRIILVHELTHVKQKALWVRKAAQLCLIIHWFNPSVYQCKKEIVRWTEFRCDAAASAFLEGMNYYHVIFAHAGGSSGGSLQMVSLKEKECDIVERMDKAVKRQETKKERKKLICSAAVMSLLCAGILGLSAAVYAEAIEQLSELTKVEIKLELPEKPPAVLYTDNGPAEGIQEVEGVVEITRDGTITANWTVANGTSASSNETLTAVNGDSIHIGGLIQPFNQTVKVGVQRVGGTRTYAEKSGGFEVSIPITIAGNYKIFVENTSGASVTVILEAGVE